MDTESTASNIIDFDFKALDANKAKPSDPALDKRRQIYKNVRKDIEMEEKRNKEMQIQRKMTELEKKVQEKDMEKKLAEERDL